MRGIKGLMGACAAVGLAVLATLAWADDKQADKKTEKAEKVAADKLPEKIKAAIKERLPGAEVTSAEKENEDGKVVYDIELKHEGRKYEMDILEDGTLIEIEKEVKAKDLPEAVAKAIKDKYPDATIKEIMEVNKVKDKKETPDHYEVVLVGKDKKEKEVEVSLDGKSVKGGDAEKDKN
jgi:hypothetical protein